MRIEITLHVCTYLYFINGKMYCRADKELRPHVYLSTIVERTQNIFYNFFSHHLSMSGSGKLENNYLRKLPPPVFSSILVFTYKGMELPFSSSSFSQNTLTNTLT